MDFFNSENQFFQIRSLENQYLQITSRRMMKERKERKKKNINWPKTKLYLAALIPALIFLDFSSHSKCYETLLTKTGIECFFISFLCMQYASTSTTVCLPNTSSILNPSSLRLSEFGLAKQFCPIVTIQTQVVFTSIGIYFLYYSLCFQMSFFTFYY